MSTYHVLHRLYLPVALLCCTSATPALWAADQLTASTQITARLVACETKASDGSAIPLWVLDVPDLVKELGAAPVSVQPASDFAETLRRGFKQRLLAAIAKLDQDHPWLPAKAAFSDATVTELSARIGDPVSGWFLETVAGDITVDATDGPADGGAAELTFPEPNAKARVWKLSFTEVSTPIGKVSLNIASAEGATVAATFEGTLADAALRVGVKPQPGDKRIALSIRLSRKDVDSTGPEAQAEGGTPEGHAIAEAIRLAIDLRDCLNRTNAGVGAFIEPLQSVGPENIARSVTAPFVLVDERNNVTGVSAGAVEFSDNEERLTVKVVFTRDVRIAGAAPADDGTAQALAKRYDARLRRELAGRIARSVNVGRVLYELTNDESVKSAFARSSEGILTFTVATRTVLKHFVPQWGGGYNTHTGVYGTGGLLLDAIPRQGDQVKVDASAGPQLVHLELGGSSPERPHPYDAGSPWWLGAGLSGAFDFNNKAHFRELTPDATTSRETSLFGSLTLGVDSFSLHDLLVWGDLDAVERRTARHRFLVTPGYEVSFLSLEDKNPKRTLSEGQITAINMRPQYILEWDLRRQADAGGLTSFRLQAAADMVKAGKWLKADYSYDTVAPNVSAEMTFGFDEPNEFLLRARAGTGTSSRGTPVQRQFQIGGPDYVRGLERGEFTANAFLWQQFEFGPNAGWLWSRIRPKKKQTNAADSGPALPFDIRSSYIKVFFDQARVSHSVSVPSLLDRATSLHGMGIAAELGKVSGKFNLTAGYGYSPQSTLHKHGAFFLGVELR